MRRFLLCILIIGVISSSLYSPVNADENKLNIFLEVNFDEANHATIIFSLGTQTSSGVRPISVNDWSKEWDRYIFHLGNATLERYIASRLNNSAEDFVKKVLGIEGRVTVNSIQAANDSSWIYIKMGAEISDTTLHPLSFLGTEYEGEKIEEIADIKVKISASNAALETPVLEFIVFHYRLPTGEYLEYSSTTNTINVNSNPFFSPLGAFVVLIVFAVSGIGICMYGRKYMRGTKLGVEVWVLASIFYFCAFIPLSVYLVYVFIVSGLVLSFIRVFRAIRLTKPKAKPKKTPASVSGAAVEKYLGKTEKPKPKKTVGDEEAEKAYIDLSKYSEFKVIPKTEEKIVKKEEKKEEKEEMKEKKPGVDVASLLKLGKKETVKDKEEKKLVKLMEKKGFEKAEDKDA